jgi:hypothetical protein
MNRKTFEQLVQFQLGDTLGAHGFFLNPQKPEDAVDDPPCALFDATVNEFHANYPNARLDLDLIDAVTIRVLLRGTLVVELENLSLAEASLAGEGVSPESEQLIGAFAILRQDLAEILSSSATLPPRSSN